MLKLSLLGLLLVAMSAPNGAAAYVMLVWLGY
jgi:hypothetical protein